MPFKSDSQRRYIYAAAARGEKWAKKFIADSGETPPKKRGMREIAGEALMGLSLWIPPAAVAYRCSCGSEFADKQAGIRHAVRCVKKRADEIEERTEIREASALGGPLDKEMDAWARRRIAEGKKGFNDRGRAA